MGSTVVLRVHNKVRVLTLSSVRYSRALPIVCNVGKGKEREIRGEGDKRGEEREGKGEERRVNERERTGREE